MFSPATRKSHLVAQKDRSLGRGSPVSPSTPLADDRRAPSGSSTIPDRPTTGTPAPWSSRLSVLARIPSGKKSQKGADADQIQPVYVGEFPQVVRRAQADLLQKSDTGNVALAGGMDKETLLSWIICGSQLFIWSYLSAAVSKLCVALEIPSAAAEERDIGVKSRHANYWLVSVVKWGRAAANNDTISGQCDCGIVICNKRTQAIVYWPDIFSESMHSPVVSIPTSWSGSNYLSEHEQFTSLISSAIPGATRECIGIACQSGGHLWRLHCTPFAVCREKISQIASSGSTIVYPQINKVHARSLVWRLQHASPEKSDREFFLLTDHEIQCWSVMLARDMSVVKLWTHEIVGSDGDVGIKKDLAGQKHIWLLDMQVDDRGKEFTILVATLCKDRVSSSSYTQYSLLTMQYKPGENYSAENLRLMNGRILEKKTPLQVIIPKARVEDEDFLFSMRLRVGGRPSGSAIIISGDGTATVTNYWRGSTRLYQFDLPWDAGKVLDASVFTSTEDNEEGAWVVLTEKAGIWAIPEKAVLIGGVEPPERSLSRKGSTNGGAAEGEKRNQAFGGNIVPRRASSEAWSSGDRQRAVLAGITQRSAQDEEAEALLARLFHDFALTGEVDDIFENLKRKGAFEKEGETNIFARMSKSIVDTLAKHWTTTRGAEFVTSAVVSSLLLDKQQKHEKYLQFLALSKCHEELSSRQRWSMLTIMEHGEKLSSMIQLRELQNFLSQSRSNEAASPSSQSTNQMSGSVWNLIQLVGEKARRNTVLLMDRENAEVFYSKVSEIEELFNCLSQHLHYILGIDQPLTFQMQRASEISNAATTIIQTSMGYRVEHQTWYPSPEGLTPWNCQPAVRLGLWTIASFVMQLLRETAIIDISARLDLCSQLEKLVDVLLEAYLGAITSKIEREEEHKGLVEEYCSRRQELLGTLYQQAKRIADARYQDSCQGAEDHELKEAIYQEVYSPLLFIAKRHEGYQAMWDICYDLSDTGLLRSLMHDSIGPKRGFSNFVFNQLIKGHQYAKLLRLGEEFQEDLSSFLQERSDLLWLHEIFLNQFSSASETLHALALSQDDSPMLVNEDKPQPARIKKTMSLADRRHLLNLSKIAAMAGKGVGSEMEAKRIEADLQILELQEEIVGRLSSSDEMQDISKPLSPGRLVDMCIKGKSKDQCLKAFEVFAWTSSSFQSSNRSRLEDCWRNAADQDNWLALSQASTTEGWSDEVTRDCLKETMLFKASNRCYGPESETYDGRFEDVLPLQKEVDSPTLNDPSSSVEGILMQHKDFPDAGKLMLTAVMLGKAGNNAIVEEDMPMDS